MNFKTKLLVITLLPTMLIAITSMYIIDQTSIRLIESQAKVIEEIYLEQKEKELRNYVTIAEKALTPSYKSYLKTERRAKAEAQRIVRKMTFGEDNYFYIYDGEGKNIVNPRHTHLIGSNWLGIRDQNGQTVIKDLIAQAKTDGASYAYNWKKPSSGEYVEKLGYSIYLPKWDWILGTGIYLDDVSEQIQKVQAET